MSIQTYQWGNTRRSSFRVERWTWSMRGWLLVALILAVLLHWWMFQIYDTYSLHQASARMMADPRPERIAVNPEVLQDRPAQPVIPDIIAPSDSPPEPDTKADYRAG
jgi:hypothetical protein